MKIAFRQGIIRYKSDVNNLPNYLVKSSLNGSFIDLIVAPDPTVLTFAHGKANYTIEEVTPVSHAWGPFQPNGQTQFLYWDIDTFSGKLTRSFTLLAPLTGPIAPNTPAVDQHWFDTSTTTMKVWNGQAWVVRIRLFAGIYSHDAIIIPQPLGSQIGLNNYQGTSGMILLDDQLSPLRASDQTFLTSETNFHVGATSNNPNSSLRFETINNFVKAAEYIPGYSVVTLVASDTVMLGRYANNALVHGIVTEDMFIGDVARLTTNGIVYNEQWNFQSTVIGKPLFCGDTGQITLTPPPFGEIQMVGTVDSNKTINVSIQAPVYYIAQI